jgi:hypothetical protein
MDFMFESPSVRILLVAIFVWLFVTYLSILCDRWEEISLEIEEERKKLEEENQLNKKKEE